MDLLRLFLSASASPLVQARTAGPLAVDTGPPGSGGPPLVVDGFQKEVTANEQKPQATILDLLETILPNNATSVKEGKSGGLTLTDLAINLGDLKAKVETPDFRDILSALGVVAPLNFDATNLGQFKKTLAEAVVDKVLPAPIKSVFAKIVKALGEFEDATGVAPQTLPKPTSKVPIRIVPLGEVPIGSFAEPQPVGPPIRIVPGPGQQFGADQWPNGSPLSKADPSPGAVTGHLSLVQNFEGLKATLPPPPPDSTNTFSTDARKRGDSVGLLENRMIDALKVSSVSVSGSKPIDLSALAESISGRHILQKAPHRTPHGQKAGWIEVPIGQPVLTANALTSAIEDRAGFASMKGAGTKETDPLLQASKPVPTQFVGIKNRLRLTANGKDFLEKSGKSKEALTTPITDEQVAEEAVKGAKPVEANLTKEVVEHDDVNTLNVDQDDSIQLGRPERTLDVSSTKDAKHVTSEITTEQYHEAKAKVIEQIEEIAATRGNGRVTIRLNPDDLGTITLAVRSFGDNVEAKITASNDNVRQSLHTHRADLVQSVESRGLNMNSFTVGSETHADAQQHGSGKQQGQDMRQEFARSHNLWNTSHDKAPAPRPTFQRLRYAGVDTFA